MNTNMARTTLALVAAIVLSQTAQARPPAMPDDILQTASLETDGSDFTPFLIDSPRDVAATDGTLIEAEAGVSTTLHSRLEASVIGMPETSEISSDRAALTGGIWLFLGGIDGDGRLAPGVTNHAKAEINQVEPANPLDHGKPEGGGREQGTKPDDRQRDGDRIAESEPGHNRQGCASTVRNRIAQHQQHRRAGDRQHHGAGHDIGKPEFKRHGQASRNSLWLRASKAASK